MIKKERQQHIEEQTDDMLVTIGKACISLLIARKVYRRVENVIVDKFIISNNKALKTTATNSKKG